MFREFIASQFKKPEGLFGIFTSNMMVKNNRKNYERLIKDLDLHSNFKLLEIGYGPGIGITMIEEQCPTCTVDGIDFSKLMFRRASKYNKQYINNNKVALWHGDFLQLPVTDKQYDRIFCVNVIYFWNSLKEPFEKVFSLLKQGGSFHIYMAGPKFLKDKSAPDSVFSKYSIEQVTEQLKAAGFTAVQHATENGHHIKARK